MKNHLNIKMLLITMFSLMCFFVVNDGVKADSYRGSNGSIPNVNPTSCNGTYTKTCNYISLNDFREYLATSKSNITDMSAVDEVLDNINLNMVSDYKLLKLHFNSDSVCFDGEVIEEIQKNKSVLYDISSSDFTNDECPKSIYVNNTFAANHVFLSLVKLDSDITHSSEKYGILRTMSDEEIKENDKCETIPYIKTIYNFVRFLVPVIIIVLSIIDFAGVVISGEDDKMEKSKKKFVIRIIVGIVILFIPIILELLLKIIGILESNEKLYDIACLK